MAVRRIAKTKPHVQERSFEQELAYGICKAVYGAKSCSCAEGPHATACMCMVLAARLTERKVCERHALTNGDR